MVAERCSDLGRGLKAVLQVLPVWVIGEECEAGQLRLSGADPLVQSVEELLHRGGTIKTHHLCDRNAREPHHHACFEMKVELSRSVSCLAKHELHICRPKDSLFRTAVLHCWSFLLSTSLPPP